MVKVEIKPASGKAHERILATYLEWINKARKGALRG